MMFCRACESPTAVYNVRTIATYIIACVDRSLFIFAYNNANNFRNAKIYSSPTEGKGVGSINVVVFERWS